MASELSQWELEHTPVLCIPLEEYKRVRWIQWLAILGFVLVALSPLFAKPHHKHKPPAFTVASKLEKKCNR